MSDYEMDEVELTLQATCSKDYLKELPITLTPLRASITLSDFANFLDKMDIGVVLDGIEKEEGHGLGIGASVSSSVLQLISGMSYGQNTFDLLNGKNLAFSEDIHIQEGESNDTYMGTAATEEIRVGELHWYDTNRLNEGNSGVKSNQNYNDNITRYTYYTQSGYSCFPEDISTGVLVTEDGRNVYGVIGETMTTEDGEAVGIGHQHVAGANQYTSYITVDGFGIPLNNIYDSTGFEISVRARKIGLSGSVTLKCLFGEEEHDMIFTDSWSEITLGSSTDLWGDTWTYTDLPNLMVKFRHQNSLFYGIEIDYVKIKIYKKLRMGNFVTPLIEAPTPSPGKTAKWENLKLLYDDPINANSGFYYHVFNDRKVQSQEIESGTKSFGNDNVREIYTQFSGIGAPISRIDIMSGGVEGNPADDVILDIVQNITGTPIILQSYTVKEWPVAGTIVPFYFITQSDNLPYQLRIRRSGEQDSINYYKIRYGEFSGGIYGELIGTQWQTLNNQGLFYKLYTPTYLLTDCTVDTNLSSLVYDDIRLNVYLYTDHNTNSPKVKEIFLNVQEV
jgi:hypothetical protein